VVPTLFKALLICVRLGGFDDHVFSGLRLELRKRKQEVQKGGVKADDAEDDSEDGIEREVIEGFRCCFP